VWAVGCIFAELLGGKPLFPGTDYLDQLARIIAVLGSPTAAETAFVKSPRARAFLDKHLGKPRVPFAALFPRASPAGLDLLARLLDFNPERRISVEGALRHDYFAALRADAEPPPPPPAKIDASIEALQALPLEELRAQMAREIADFRPAAPR